MRAVCESGFKRSDSLALTGVQLVRQEEGRSEHDSLVLRQSYWKNHLVGDVQVPLHHIKQLSLNSYTTHSLDSISTCNFQPQTSFR